MKGTLSSTLFPFKCLVLCSRELYQQLSTKPWDHVMDEERTSFGGGISLKDPFSFSDLLPAIIRVNDCCCHASSCFKCRWLIHTF